MVLTFSGGSSRWKEVALAAAAVVGLVAAAAVGVFMGRYVLHSRAPASDRPADVAKTVLMSVPLIDGWVYVG